MKIAYTMTEGRGELDRALADLARSAARAGLRTCGIVQINTDIPGSHRCDMDVLVLPEGPEIRISQFLGKDAAGCTLNPDALETAVARVAETMTRPYDLFFLNKFGKSEASGRGFRDLMAQAVADGAAVLVGVNGQNRDAFVEFTGGVAEYVAPDEAAMQAWITRVSRQP